jgi:hypothetical protein
MIIKVEIDHSCHMARVYDENGKGMERNFWDFHNGCRGLYNFDNFTSIYGFVYILRKFHEDIMGEKVELIKSEYKYGLQ